MDAEVRKIVDTALEQSARLLAENRDSLEKIAERLLETEVLEGEELDRLLADARTRHAERSGDKPWEEAAAE